MTFSFNLWTDHCALDHLGNLSSWSVTVIGRKSHFNVLGQLHAHGAKLAHFGHMICPDEAYFIVKTDQDEICGRPPRFFKTSKREWNEAYHSCGARTFLTEIDEDTFQRALVENTQKAVAAKGKHPLFT